MQICDHEVMFNSGCFKLGFPYAMSSHGGHNVIQLLHKPVYLVIWNMVPNDIYSIYHECKKQQDTGPNII